MKKHKKILIIITTILILLLFLLIISTIFALKNSKSKTILNGISINNIDISNLTIEEAENKLNAEFEKQLSNNITITYLDYTSTISPTEFDCKYDITSAVQEAYKVGKSGNIFQNNYTILFSMFSSKNFNVNLTYHEEKLNNIIDDISVRIPGLAVEPSYYISDNNLIILKGTNGIELLKDDTKSAIISTIKNNDFSKALELPVKEKQVASIELNKIYEEIYSEPQNASVQKNPFKLNPGSEGIDFAISFEEAEQMLKQDLEEYIIPLKYTNPEITINDLGDDIFPHTLSYYTTKYNESDTERVTNLKLATEKINGIVLLPEEIFSFNQTVGKRTIEAGYQEAVIYANGQAEYGLGGGICQISSTLYNSVLLANLDIVERKNHSMTVSYVNLGRDATVSYNTIDFKFKNSRTYPIRIDATVRNGTVTISIQGIREETEYNVDIVTETTQTIPYEIKYVNDSSLAEGEQVVHQSGKYGYKSSTYKILTLNGITISKTLLSTDTYNSQPRIIYVNK